MTENSSPRPFVVDIPQAEVDDLQDRLARTRFPDEPGSGWSFGVDPAYLRDLVAYWRTGFDWSAAQTALNAVEHFQVVVDGVLLHYVHHRSGRPDATPVLLTHGWPDTFDRFHRLAPLLTDPSLAGDPDGPAFDVVIPSIPGFGFSERVALSSDRVADLFATLLHDVLGYDRVVALGGDLGSGVSIALARRHPDLVSGLHLTDVGYPTGSEDTSTFTPAEAEFAQFIQGWWFTEGAYAMLQSTKPQTIAYSLTDSPVGLAAWILSFVATGADDGDVESAFGGRDCLLTTICLYWFTATAGSAARMYAVDAQAAWGGPAPTRPPAPAAFARFPREAPTPREWVERAVSLRRFTPMPRGGHFAALEEPHALAADLRAFVREAVLGQ